MKYIDADKLKAEIERRKKAIHSTLFNDEYNDLLSFLDTLESEKPINQEEIDLKKELHDFIMEFGPAATFDKCASRFYDLGCRRTADKYDEIEYNRQRAEESVSKDLEGNSEIPNNHDGIDKKAGKRLRRVCNLAEELKEDRTLEERLQELKEIRAKKGLDEAAKEYVKDIPTFKDSCLMKAAFEDGWLSCNEKMMKEAVEGDVNTYHDLVASKSWAEFVVEMPTNNLGDKVRVIVIPKED